MGQVLLHDRRFSAQVVRVPAQRLHCNSARGDTRARQDAEMMPMMRRSKLWLQGLRRTSICRSVAKTNDVRQHLPWSATPVPLLRHPHPTLCHRPNQSSRSMRAHRLLEVSETGLLETMTTRLDDSLGTPAGPHLLRPLRPNVLKIIKHNVRRLALGPTKRVLQQYHGHQWITRTCPRLWPKQQRVLRGDVRGDHLHLHACTEVRQLPSKLRLRPRMRARR